MYFTLQSNYHTEQWLQWSFWETIHSVHEDSTNMRLHYFLLCSFSQIWRSTYFVISLAFRNYDHYVHINCSHYNGNVKFVWPIISIPSQPFAKSTLCWNEKVQGNCIVSIEVLSLSSLSGWEFLPHGSQGKVNSTS